MATKKISKTTQSVLDTLLPATILPDIDCGPVVAKARRVRKAKITIVEEPLKNPIQIRHLRSEVQPKGKKALVGVDTLTVCGRVVVKQMTRVKPPTGRTVKVCPHCVEEGHEDTAFTITE